VIAVTAYVRRRADARHLALACALPCFLVLMSATTAWTPLLVRFFVVPAAVGAPLLAWLFAGRATILAYGTVAVVTASLTVAHDQAKPLSSPNGLGRPWNLSLTAALETNSRPDYAAEVTGLDSALPSGCLGAIVRESDPVYLLYGSHFQRHVIYLPPNDPAPEAYAAGLTDVVVNSDLGPVADPLAANGWKVRPIGGHWLLATRTVPPGTACRA
jgi:hypothetical protein